MTTTTTTEEHSPTCYPNQHMSLQDYALYEVAMRLTSGGSRPLIFDGRKLAKRFKKASKSGIYRTEKSLVAAGWFKLPADVVGKKFDPTTKRYTATTYQVLTHDEWIAKHGDSECIKCLVPVPYLGQEAIPPRKRKTRATSQLKRFMEGMARISGIGDGIQTLNPEVIRTVCKANDLEMITQYGQYLPTIHKFVDAVLNIPVPSITVPSTGMELEPVPESEHSCPKTEESLSQNQQTPVPPAGHSLLDSSLKALLNTSIGADAPFSLDSSGDSSEVKPTRKAKPWIAPRHDHLPEWIPLESWDAFVELRKQKRKPITFYAYRLLMDRLCKFHDEGQDIKAILDASVENGWTGLFPPRERSAARPKPSRHAGFEDKDYTAGTDGWNLGGGR
jgi:hypothetical protein